MDKHNGNLEPIKSVQNPSCAYCKGIMRTSVGTQVSEIELKVCHIRSREVQCNLNDKETQDEMCQATLADIDKITGDEIDNVSKIPRIECHNANYVTVPMNVKESIDMTQVTIEDEVISSNTVKDTGDTSTHINFNNCEGDDKLDEFNSEVYKQFCRQELCDKHLMEKLVEILHENSSLKDFL